MSADDLPDADDADAMGPPKEPCECWCMHCRRVFMSTGMWFQRVVGDPQGFKGYWMCPTPNCDGAGFTIDIFPTDPDHPSNAGWSYSDDDQDEYDDDGNPVFIDGNNGDDEDGGDWDPDESKWKELDEELAACAGEDGCDDDEDDLEGEEWKHGLQPGERPPEPAWMEEARREQEERERQYDEPDRRPREVDWGDRQDRNVENRSMTGDDWTEDDIPF